MSPYRSVFQAGLFNGQVAIVTGGSSGIGRCTAHELAALGAAVAIVGRKIEKLDAVRAEIEAVGGVCMPGMGHSGAARAGMNDVHLATVPKVLQG